MSAVAAVLAHLKAAGVSIAVADGQIKLKGPRGALDDGVLNELRRIKSELLEFLKAVEAAPGPTPPIDRDAIAARIESWLAAMDRLPKACGSQAAKLKVITQDFALGPWAAEFVRLGWSDGDLFALDGGLIPETSRRALYFRKVGADAVSLINERAAFEDWPRPDAGDALPWWEDRRCVTRHH